MPELEIYRPTIPQLEPESFLRRFDKKQEKQTKVDGDRQDGSSSRRNRRNDPSRVARRRQQLYTSYAVAIERVAELNQAKALIGRTSEEGNTQIRKWLPERAVNAYLGICTLGASIDSYMRELTAEDLAAAAVLNEVALAWIVAITQEMRDRVGAEVRPEGLKAGAAYRPGLGRWPLQVQKTIFDELPTQQIGVTLTESLLMLPSFSTSLVIPVIPTT